MTLGKERFVFYLIVYQSLLPVLLSSEKWEQDLPILGFLSTKLRSIFEHLYYCEYWVIINDLISIRKI